MSSNSTSGNSPASASRLDGGDVLAGGGAAAGPGFFVKSTVIANVDHRLLGIGRDEVFGLVLVAMPYNELDEAITAANDSEYRLGASVWTDRLASALQVVDRVKAGIVWVNAHNMVNPALPFGGF
ncbi:aldehyde dehydrogenase family protein [Burkholderia mayonis]|uniref:aldehyde dehydrogenase family protein n=1 Tax=Burkholderia mayonis TaxID=1385591 RepID=UPI001CF7BFB0|nr:aldehyde dehydrogenase family protein [Burkholderia mayonis]